MDKERGRNNNTTSTYLSTFFKALLKVAQLPYEHDQLKHFFARFLRLKKPYLDIEAFDFFASAASKITKTAAASRNISSNVHHGVVDTKAARVFASQCSALGLNPRQHAYTFNALVEWERADAERIAALKNTTGRGAMNTTKHLSGATANSPAKRTTASRSTHGDPFRSPHRNSNEVNMSKDLMTSLRPLNVPKDLTDMGIELKAKKPVLIANNRLLACCAELWDCSAVGAETIVMWDDVLQYEEPSQAASHSSSLKSLAAGAKQANSQASGRRTTETVVGRRRMETGGRRVSTTSRLSPSLNRNQVASGSASRNGNRSASRNGTPAGKRAPNNGTTEFHKVLNGSHDVDSDEAGDNDGRGNDMGKGCEPKRRHVSPPTAVLQRWNSQRLWGAAMGARKLTELDDGCVISSPFATAALKVVLGALCEEGIGGLPRRLAGIGAGDSGWAVGRGSGVELTGVDPPEVVSVARLMRASFSRLEELLPSDVLRVVTAVVRTTVGSNNSAAASSPTGKIGGKGGGFAAGAGAGAAAISAAGSSLFVDTAGTSASHWSSRRPQAMRPLELALRATSMSAFCCEVIDFASDTAFAPSAAESRTQCIGCSKRINGYCNGFTKGLVKDICTPAVLVAGAAAAKMAAPGSAGSAAAGTAASGTGEQLLVPLLASAAVLEAIPWQHRFTRQNGWEMGGTSTRRRGGNSW
jgi:hypothetical protein